MGSQKSSQKILALITGQPKITIDKLASKLKISTRAVKKQLQNLKEKGLLKRIGPEKGGHCEATE